MPRILFHIIFLSGFVSSAEELDRRCLDKDCVSLRIESGRVYVDNTGEFARTIHIGTYDISAKSDVPPTEAPILSKKTSNGWIAIVTASLPSKFDFNAPVLRVYILNRLHEKQLSFDSQMTLDSFRAGRLFNVTDEFVQISASGEHAYVVQTVVWHLPKNGSPKLMIDVPGLVAGINVVSRGIWIDRQTYDGIHAESKGHRRELWSWRSGRFMMTR